MNLMHSGVYLQGVMARWRRACLGLRRASTRPDLDAKGHLSDFPVPYFTLSSLECKARELCQNMPDAPDDAVADSRCQYLSKLILDYLSKLGSHYDGFIGQKSIAILTVMELVSSNGASTTTFSPHTTAFYPAHAP